MKVFSQGGTLDSAVERKVLDLGYSQGCNLLIHIKGNR